jgi:transposase InsO family protein
VQVRLQGQLERLVSYRVGPRSGGPWPGRGPSTAALSRPRGPDRQWAEFQCRFHWHLESHDIRHVYPRPRTPHLNGKVERSHRVDQQEFYQLDKNGIADDFHLFNDKLREWEDYYNYHRPHGALDGQTPYERLMAKSAATVSTKS